MAEIQVELSQYTDYQHVSTASWEERTSAQGSEKRTVEVFGFFQACGMGGKASRHYDGT